MSVVHNVILVSLATLAASGLAILTAWVVPPRWTTETKGGKRFVWMAILTCVALISVGSLTSSLVIQKEGSVATVPVTITTEAVESEREPFTVTSRPATAELNSIINSEIGDERNFVRMAKGKTDDHEKFSTSLKMKSGDTITVRLYVRNAAEESSGAVAENVRARIALGNYYASESTINSYVFWENSDQGAAVIGATTKVKSDGADVKLVPNFNSVRFKNDKLSEAGLALGASLFSAHGADIGCASNNGELPASATCSGYVEFNAFIEVEPELPRTDEYTSAISFLSPGGGADSWQKELTIEPDAKIWVRVSFNNFGTNQQKSVRIALLQRSYLTTVEAESFTTASDTLTEVFSVICGWSGVRHWV